MISWSPILKKMSFSPLSNLSGEATYWWGGGGVKAMVENGIVDNVSREGSCQIPSPLFHEDNKDEENIKN